MKHAIFALVCMISIACVPCHAADTYIQLDTNSDDEHSDEKRPTVTIKTLYDGGVRTANQTLNLAKRELTSTHDLPKFRTKLQLGTLTLLNVCNDYLKSEDLGTVLRHAVALQTLIASGNRIKSVGLLPKHDNLEILFLNNNRIDEFKVASFCQKFPKLHQLTLKNNPLTSNTVTNISGTHAAMKEIWFDDQIVTPSIAARCIRAFPNLSCELATGSRAVQKYYSTTKQQWDDCIECEAPVIGVIVYVVAPIMGASLGVAIGGVVSAFTVHNIPCEWKWGINCRQQGHIGYNPQCQPFMDENERLINQWMAIFVPLGAALPPLIYRVGKTVYNWRRTKPHERYKTVYTREIRAEPTFLDLVDNLVEQAPNQEDEV